MTAPAPRRLLWLLAPVAAFAATLALLNAVQGGGGAAAPAVFDRPGPASVDVPPGASTAETIAATRAAIEEEPGDAALHAALGDLYYQRGRETADSSWNEKAHEAYRRALALDPESAQATTGLGTLALAKHDFAGGLRYGEQALRLEPELGAALRGDRRRPARARPLRGCEALARPDGVAQAEPRLLRAHLLLPRAPRRPRRRARGDAARRVRRRRLRRERRLRRDAARQPRVPGAATSRAPTPPTAPRSRACPSTCPRRPGSRRSRPRRATSTRRSTATRPSSKTSAVHEYHLLLLEAQLADGRRRGRARGDRGDPREPGDRAQRTASTPTPSSRSSRPTTDRPPAPSRSAAPRCATAPSVSSADASAGRSPAPAAASRRSTGRSRRFARAGATRSSATTPAWPRSSRATTRSHAGGSRRRWRSTRSSRRFTRRARSARSHSLG